MEMHEQGTELVLMPNEYCIYLDRTKGNLNVVAGPFKQSLSQTDQLVEWSNKEKRFVSVEYRQAKRNFIVIPEGWYAPLKNPASRTEHPVEGRISEQSEAGLQIGKKVNIPGPASFALWPGQMAKVIEGHKLRSNQYLLVRVYDVEAFKSELNKAAKEQGGVVQAKKEEGAVNLGENETVAARTTDIYGGLVAEKLATGQQFIIKGTDVHFYIPPDGVEVVPVGSGTYVQDAVTLQQLQYCMLQDESGEKRYVRGPDVVFPLPTERFLVSKNKDGSGKISKKFTAIELNETSGIYIKVIKPYTDDEGRAYTEGEELFITGKEQKIYFPRAEHAIVKYDNQDKHYAVALPEGEGRYVLDRVGGGISKVMGPTMFLPDPRTQVIVNRILTDRESELFFPGNMIVRNHNEVLRGQTDLNYVEATKTKGLAQDRMRSSRNITNYSASFDMNEMLMGSETSEVGVIGDAFERGGQFKPPRTITLGGKLDGIVSLDIWNGFSVMVKDRSGSRRVIDGPTRIHLEYGETLDSFSCSRGTPKNHDNMMSDVYLRVKNNCVSDVMRVQTSDLCEAQVKLSMRVDFVGESQEEKIKWWAVDNYVKLLSERVSSLLANHVRMISIKDFYSDSTNIIRDILLGENVDGERKGLVFEENNMVVSEVEVLTVRLSDGNLARALQDAASDSLTKGLDYDKKLRDANLEMELSKLAIQVIETRIGAERRKLELEAEKEMDRLEKEKAQEEMTAIVKQAEIEVDKVRWLAELEEMAKKAEQENKRRNMDAEVEIRLMQADSDRSMSVMQSIQPKLVEALSALGDNDRISKLAHAVAPQAMFGTNGVKELMEAQFSSLGFGSLFDRLGLGVKKLMPTMTPTPKKK